MLLLFCGINLSLTHWGATLLLLYQDYKKEKYLKEIGADKNVKLFIRKTNIRIQNSQYISITNYYIKFLGQNPAQKSHSTS